MPDRFVSLATLVRAGRIGDASHERPIAAHAPSPPAHPPPTDSDENVPSHRAGTQPTHVVRNVRDFAHADVVHELALLRLAAREAFERAATTLLETLARDVLARELRLAPADVASLVTTVLASAATNEPVTIVVSRVDRDRVHAALPVRVDETLEAGDLVVEVRDGSFVSTFALRLEDALARVAASVRV